MSYKCFKCKLNFENTKELVAHLKKDHQLEERNNNFQISCGKCNSILHTYSGFHKHLQQCYLKPSPLNLSPKSIVVKKRKKISLAIKSNVIKNSFTEDSANEKNFVSKTTQTSPRLFSASSVSLNKFHQTTPNQRIMNEHHENSKSADDPLNKYFHRTSSMDDSVSNLVKDMNHASIDSTSQMNTEKNSNISDKAALTQEWKSKVQERVLDFMALLYSFKLPDSSINKILHFITFLLLPLLILEENDYSRFELMMQINSMQETLKTQSTTYERRKKIVENMVQPCHKTIGIRYDNFWDNNLKRRIERPASCFFAYVPLLNSLKFLLKQDSILKYVIKKPTKDPTGYSHFIDGTTYQNAEIFKSENAIQIQIFQDEFETCNPLGSKAGCHKMCGFYFTINNLPNHMKSSLKHIHLLALAHSIDIKNFGMKPILDVIVSELKVLENEGIYCEGLKKFIKGTLVSLSHDNLGSGPITGTVEGFNANNYCRICLMEKSECQTACEEKIEYLRTASSFSEYAEEAKKLPANKNNYLGVKYSSPLNKLKYFNFANNPSVDVMHDLLEGVVQREIRAFFKFLIDKNITTMEEINNEIHRFDFGCNAKDKPSGIDLTKESGKIRNSASQTLQLLINLPFLCTKFVSQIPNKEINKWKTILKLIKIVKICLAPKIFYQTVETLKLLILEHHRLYQKAYGQPLTPKHHFMTHYPSIIKKLGPLKSLWTMRYESKHYEFAKTAKSLGNYKDVSFLLATRHQQKMIHLWDNDQEQAVNALKNVQQDKFEDFRYRKLLQTELNFDDTYIFTGNKVTTVHNYEFKIDSFIMTSISNQRPNFVKILGFFHYKKNVFAITQECATKGLSETTLAYIIKNSDSCKIIKVDDLVYSKNYNGRVLEDDYEIVTEYLI